jgi:hypothetical protein
MPDQEQPEPVDFSDFTADVAANTGVSSAELTGRVDTVIDPCEDLLTSARATSAETAPERGADLPEVLRPVLDQYETQAELMFEVGCEWRDGGLSFTGIDGRIYTLPDQDRIERLLAEKADLYAKKAEQGFDQLLLVPFGMSIDHLATQYGEALRNAYASGRLRRGVAGQPLKLDTDNPIVDAAELRKADLEDKIVYGVEYFDSNHGGKTKSELLAEGSASGWQIFLMQNVDAQGLGDNPREEGVATVGGRTQLPTNWSADIYLAEIGNGQYEAEVGLTPESYIMLALNQLKEHGKVLDIQTTTILTGALMPDSRLVPNSDWHRIFGRVRMSAFAPHVSEHSYGVRTGVRVA